MELLTKKVNGEKLLTTFRKELHHRCLAESLNLLVPTPQNGQRHSNCLSVFDRFVGLTLKRLKRNKLMLTISM